MLYSTTHVRDTISDEEKKNIEAKEQLQLIYVF